MGHIYIGAPLGTLLYRISNHFDILNVNNSMDSRKIDFFFLIYEIEISASLQ